MPNRHKCGDLPVAPAHGSAALLQQRESQRRCPRPMPRIPAFRRSARSVRFIFLAISGSDVRAFECALSSRTSSLVHGVRWAEVFFFGTCCSGKGSRPRTTPSSAADAREQKKRLSEGSARGGRIFPLTRPSGLRTTTSTPACDRAKDHLAVNAFRYVRCAQILLKNSNFRVDHNSEDRWQPRWKFP